MWWRLDEPITDPVLSEALLKGMAAALGGDPTVANPSRVMRLAGTIASPMKLPDRKRPELTFIAPLRATAGRVYSTRSGTCAVFPPAPVNEFEMQGI